MQPLTKNRQDDDVINHTSVIFKEYDIKLSRHMNSVQFMTKMRQDNDVTNHTGLLYAKNEIKLS